MSVLWNKDQSITKSNMSQNQIRLHFQNMTFGIGKAPTECHTSQNQIRNPIMPVLWNKDQTVTKSNVTESHESALLKYEIWNR